VSSEELADIAVYDGFRFGPNSLLGKWFAETPEAARHWGQLLYPGGVFHVIQADVPSDIADQMFRLPLLDQIGPARYAEGDVLASINQQHQGITEVP
jgi:hypothetical protein